MSDKVFSKVRKTIDTIRRTSKSSKNVFEFFTILLRDSACSECENNMADGDEVDEVFEITDFTTSSEWERFAARLEQLLIEWKLDGTNKKKSTSKGKELFNNFEKIKLNPIPHKKVEVDGSALAWLSCGWKDLEDCLPHAMMEMFDMEFDFPPRAHCLSRWYGLKEFVVISPAEDAEAVITESKCQLLLSSIGIAATNSKCAVPIFAHILQQWRRIYHGLCIGGGFRTTFHMSQLRHIPSQYGHLAGLLDIFKDKLVRKVIELTMMIIQTITIGHSHCVSASNEHYQGNFHWDLDPCHAPQWSLRAKMSENPQCLLDNLADITHALQRLTEAPPVASLSSAVSRATSRISAIGDGSLDEYPIPGKLLSEILQHLFPDADQDLEDLEAVQQELLFAKMESENDAKEENIQQVFILKSAPEDSLTFFLAVGICIVYHSYGGLKAVAHLWQEFVLEMRFRWENDIFIPRLKLQAPNLGSCLLHQKLQEPAPMTEDMLEEQAEILTQLGTSVEGARAANPGCLLEDFVRWYSPFDWILGPETQEEIEELERLKNNAEKASEEPSTPVAATVSEASFGEGWDTEEIEIADEDLVSKDAKSLMNEAKAGNLDQLQAPAKWREEGHLSLRMRIPGARDIPAVAFLLDKVLDKASKLSWEMPQDLTQCEEFVKQLQLCELVVARANSLRYKFQDALLKGTETDKDVERFLSALMEKPEVTVIGAGRGPAGRVLHSLFVKQESARMQFGGDESPFPNQQQRHSATLPQDFPSPTGREYILRTTIPKPRPSSRPCPQRMYCVLTNDEFRLAGAFTDDVIFQ
ncbi:Rab3 GTPase-activating protein catalytic subunit [Acropora cervicornis]|uniref:Rab3 GTPase-activating protein catalytic subunit n=1 Tax=Acropora cervicornis TaxID=6130 RepID=A0AAD9QFE8_ACRCE|nr:Rab3 GTPase-activating protein catalytic subunit [Acropora cervicornis]